MNTEMLKPATWLEPDPTATKPPNSGDTTEIELDRNQLEQRLRTYGVTYDFSSSTDAELLKQLKWFDENMRPSTKPAWVQLARSLSFAYPSMPFSTLALNIQAELGITVTDRQIEEALETYTYSFREVADALEVSEMTLRRDTYKAPTVLTSFILSPEPTANDFGRIFYADDKFIDRNDLIDRMRSHRETHNLHILTNEELLAEVKWFDESSKRHNKYLGFLRKLGVVC